MSQIAPRTILTTAMIDENRVSKRPVVMHVRAITNVGGGPEKTIVNSPRFLIERGFDCVCAYLHPAGDEGYKLVAERAEAAGATIVPIVDRGPFDRRIAGQLAELCKEHKVDIWHAHDYKTDFLGPFVRRRWPMKLVSTAHGWVLKTRKTPLYYAIDKWFLRKYDEVICVSEDIHKECLRWRVKPEHCRVIKNAIDSEEFRRRRSSREAKQECGLNPETLVVGGMGRLSGEKGFDLLIQAVSQLSKEGLNIQLQIAGEGKARPELEQRIEELGAHECVKLLGHVRDIKAFFQRLDVFALSSFREGLPNVVLEAMAMEVPVVATKIAGLPKLIEDGVDGILIDVGSPEQLASEIRRLAEDVELRGRMSSNAREKIEHSYSFASRMDQVVEVYRQALQGTLHSIQAQGDGC